MRAFISALALSALFAVLGCEKKAEQAAEPVAAPAEGRQAPAAEPTAAPTPAAVAGVWKEYAPAGTGFKALMPGTPKVEKQEQPTDVGPIMMHIHMVEKDSAAFLVMYSDFPEAMIKAVEPDVLLDGGVEGAAQGGKLLSQKKIELDGHKGREFVAEKTEGALVLTLKARTFLVGNRLYQTITSALKGGEPWADIEKFLASFELVKG